MNIANTMLEGAVSDSPDINMRTAQTRSLRMQQPVCERYQRRRVKGIPMY